MHWDSSIGKLCDLTQQPYEAFWYYLFVFKPKVEQIPHQVKFGTIPFDFIHPLDNTLLTLMALHKIGNTKMKVRCEIYFHSSGYEYESVRMYEIYFPS